MEFWHYEPEAGRGWYVYGRGAVTLDALGGTTAFTYDANRNLLTLTDALTHTTTYTYNDMDRVDRQWRRTMMDGHELV